MRNIILSLFLTISSTLLSQIYVPNAFSPNGDGDNDVLLVSCNDTIIEYKFTIFTRQGEIIFHSTDPAQAWVGGYEYYAPCNVFNYMLTWRTDTFSDTRKLYGFILVLR
jgi:gliding motility-associated-like protein